jgi:hypothetical protein
VPRLTRTSKPSGIGGAAFLQADVLLGQGLAVGSRGHAANAGFVPSKIVSSCSAAIWSRNSRCTDSAIDFCVSRAHSTRIGSAAARATSIRATVQLLPEPRPP